MDVEGNFIELRFENLMMKDSVTIENELQKSAFFTGFSGTEIWAEIQLPSGFEEEELEFKVKDLAFIFKTVSNLIDISVEEPKEQPPDTSISEISDVETKRTQNSKIQ